MELIKKIILMIRKFISCSEEDNVGLYAAQASFFLVFSAIPLLMFILTLVKYFLPFFVSENYILKTIAAIAPPPVDSFLTTIVTELFNKSSDTALISITAVSSLWLASRGFVSLYLGLNSIFNKDNMPGYIFSRIVSVLYTLIFSALLVVTIAVFGFGGKISELIGDSTNIFAVVINFVLRAKLPAFLVLLSLLSLMFALFYRFMAKSGLTFKEQLPGAVGAAAGWMIFSYAYSIYIKYFSNYTYVYGSLAALVFLMLWVYFCMNIWLYGAELNKFLANGFLKKKAD